MRVVGGSASGALTLGVKNMKVLIWVVTALLAAVWSGMAVVAVSLTGWMLSVVDAAQIGQAAGTMGQWPVPAWLAPWVDAAWLQGMQQVLADLVIWLEQVMPSASSLMAWITPAVWILWALGMLVLLLIAAVMHWLVGRVQTPAARPVIG